MSGILSLALGGMSLLSSNKQAKAAEKATKAQTDMGNRALDMQQAVYDDTTSRYQPFYSGGMTAFDAYLYELGLGPAPTIGGTALDINYTPGTTTTTSSGGRGGKVVDPLSGGLGGLSMLLGGGMQPRRMGGSSVSTTSPGVYTTADGKTFATMEEAQKWANSNKTGGTTYGGYEVSPMARYLMQEGVDSIEGSAASRGELFSGATLKALEDNRRELISADTTDYFNRLLGLSGMGMAAAGGQAGAGADYAAMGSDTLGQMGRATASGAYASADAFSNGMGDMAGILGYFYGNNQGNNPLSSYAASMNTTTRPMANPFY